MVNKIEQNLISRAELARRAGVSRAAVTGVVASWPESCFSGKKVNSKSPECVAYLTKRGEKPAQTEVKEPGIDPFWPQALAYCSESGDWSVDGLRKYLKIGHPRAKRLIDTMRVGELLPGQPRHDDTQPFTADPLTRRSAQTVDTTDSVDAEIPHDLREFRDWTLEALLLKFGTHTSFSVWLKSIKELEAIEEKRLKNAQTRADLVSKELMDRVIEVFDTQHMRLLKDGSKSVTAEAVSKHQAGSTLEEIEVYVSKRLGTFITAAKNRVARLEIKGRGY